MRDMFLAWEGVRTGGRGAVVEGRGLVEAESPGGRLLGAGEEGAAPPWDTMFTPARPRKWFWFMCSTKAAGEGSMMLHMLHGRVMSTFDMEIEEFAES